MIAAASGPSRYRRDGDLHATPGGLRFISSGWACLAGRTASRRLIHAVLLPGDPVDAALLAPGRCAIVALTRVETVDFEAVRPLLGSADSAAAPIAAALEAARLAADDRLIAHMSRVRGLSAYEALADFLEEVRLRLDQVGLAGPDGASMPLGQAQLGQVLGLTTSHVNRTLQQLRADGRIDLRDDRLFATASPVEA